MKVFFPLPPLAAASLLVAASLLGAPAPVPAQAQEAPLRSFVVTASRVEEDALDAPAQTTVVTAQAIAESGAGSLVEALESVAGISFRSYSSDAQAEISMRGFGENSFGRVLVLVDGRRQNNPDMQTINWLSIPLADIERVEVVLGASSVRYGNNAVGGVVNILTRQAKNGTTSATSLTVGSFGENREQFSVNVGGDRSGIVTSAEHYGTDGYRDRSGYRSASASVRGFMDLTDSLTLNAGAILNDVFYEMPGGLSETQFKADPKAALNYEDEGRNSTWTAELGVDWNPTEALSVTVPLSWSFKEIQADMKSWGAFTDRLVHNAQAAPLAIWESEFGPVPYRLVTGVDFSAAWLDVATWSEKKRTTKTNAFEISQISVGPYASARLTILDALSFEGGMRWDQSVIQAVNRDESVDDSKTHQAFVYDAALVYRPARTAKIYARYGTLFRYPFTDEQASLYGFGSDTFLADLEAEKGFNLEGGFSFGLGTLVSLDASVWWMEMTDEIAYNNATYRNENLDQTRRLGADAAFYLAPLPFLEFRGSYGYVNAVFAAGLNEGKRVPLVAGHRADAMLSLKLPFGASIAPDAAFQGASFRGGDTANSGDQIEAFTVYGLTLRFVPVVLDGTLEFTAKAGNLLDSAYAPYVYWGSWYPAIGRNFSLSASYRY